MYPTFNISNVGYIVNTQTQKQDRFSPCPVFVYPHTLLVLFFRFIWSMSFSLGFSGSVSAVIRC